MSDEPEAPRRKKPRRFTAPPQQVSESTLVGVFELPHGAGRPAPLPSPDAGTGAEAGTDAAVGAASDSKATADAAPATADAAPATAGAATATAPTPAEPGDKQPVLDQQAAEDDPRRWGDGEDDLGDWLKSQRPPHWD